MTYKEKYSKLLFSVIILSSGLCAMGVIDSVTNMFIVLSAVLYVLYRNFVIKFEIPSSFNFKEKVEYVGRHPKSHFVVLVGEGADDLAMELNVWLHFSIVTLCNVLLFVLLHCLNLSGVGIVFAFLTTAMLTYELFHLKKAKIIVLSCCLLAAFVIMACIKGFVLLRVLLVLMLLLVIGSIVAEFCRYFGKELKKVLFVRIDLPDKNSDYCEIILKDKRSFKFEERGFYPVQCEGEICIYSMTESLPKRVRREDVKSFRVTGHDFHKKVKIKDFV